MTYPADRQPWPAALRRPVRATLVAGPGGGQCHGGRARGCPPAGHPPARIGRSRRSPASTRGRWPATSGRDGSIPGIVTAPGQVDVGRPSSAVRALPRWEDQDFVGLVSPTGITDIGDPGEGGPLVAIVDLGLKANIVRSLQAARRPGPDPAPHRRTIEDALDPDDRRPGLLARARRSGPPGRSGGPRPGRDRRRPAAPGDLPWPPDRRPGGRRRDPPAALRPPRREPPGAGPVDSGRVQVTAQNHEVQVVGREPARRQRLPGEPAQPQRRLGRGPAPRRSCRSRRSSTTPRARRGRSTRWRSSTASSHVAAAIGPGGARRGDCVNDDPT
jgi:hypothetical protein